MKKILLACFSFGFALSVLAQDRVVTGRVTSKEDGTPLPGVNVVIKGTTNGSVTDSEGKYSVNVPPNGGSLVFSFIGLKSEEVAIGERAVVDIQLESDVTQLTEVVVTAQGIQQEKRALGYAVTSVSGSAVENRPEQDIGRLLSGKVPGVAINNTSGVSGTGTNFIVRGYSTVTGSKQPLFIVDGVPFNSDTNQPGDFTTGGVASSSRFLDIDPNNIDNMQVLKGLAAAVLYGEKGRNGVVIINTKNNRAAKGEHFEVNVSQSVFASQIASLPEYQPGYGDGFQQNFGYFFSNWGPSYSQLDSVGHPYGHWSDPTLQAQFPQYAGKNVKYQPYVNSVKNFFRTGVSSVTSVNLSGSNANTSYNFTAGKTSEDGFVPSNNLGKINIGAGINSNLTKKLNITVSTNYTETNLTTPPISGGGGSGPLNGVSIYSDVLYTPVNVDLMGLPFEAPIDHRSVYYRTGNDIQNPRWTAKYTKQTDDVRRFFGSTSINFKITNDLKATYRVGLDNYNETQEYVVNKGGPNFLNGFYRTQNIQNTIWNQDFLLTYTKQFNDISFSATAGVQSRQDDRTSYGMYSSNQVIFGVINHNNFLSHSNVDGLTGANLNYNSTLKYQGVYATAMIGYKDYLYLNVQGRNDWSSAVEKANSSIFYPSASISFVPTTAFGIESDALRMLRLRAGYGQSAGFPAPYNTRNYIYNNPRGFLDKAGQPVNIHSVSDQLGNPNLTPELFSEVELGVEAQMLKGRLNAEITWYNKVSKKLIMQAPIDPATGFTNTFVNLGQMTNQGIEVNINGTPIVVGDFKWDLALNFFHYTSIVNSLGSGLTQVLIPGGGYSGGPGNWAIPGQSFDVIQGTYVQRDAQGRMLVAPDGNYVPSHDQKIIGNPIPDYTSSVITSFHYKGITLSAQIDYRKGGAIYSTTAATLLARGVTQDTNFNREATFILPGVQADGSKNTVQLTSSDTFFNNYGFGPQELQVYDGTTIRLAQVSLGYSLPKSVIGKTPFKAVNISVQGQNLWYNAVNFPKYMHFDTNQLSTGVGNALGLDFLTGPSARKYGVTLGLKF